MGYKSVFSGGWLQGKDYIDGVLLILIAMFFVIIGYGSHGHLFFFYPFSHFWQLSLMKTGIPYLSLAQDFESLS